MNFLRKLLQSKTYNSENSPSYGSKKIGKNTWMIRNLDVTIYKDGSTILEAKNNAEWVRYGENGIGCWCYYDNNPENDKMYGKLYNWYAVNPNNQFGGITPLGWEIPSYNELCLLFECAGLLPNKIRDSYSNSQASKALKDQNAWSSYLQNEYNKTGWTGLPGGLRSATGQFHFLLKEGAWWSSSDAEIEEDNPVFSEHSAWCLRLKDSIKYTAEEAQMSDILSKSTGLSVRCIRN